MEASRRHLDIPALTLVVSFLAPLVTGAVAAQQTGAPPQEGGRVVQVRGSVVDHDSGEPIGGAAVSLGRGPHGTPGVGTRVTNDQGHFLFDEVPPGTYRLRVTMLGYHTMTDTVQVPTEGAVDLVLPLSTEPILLEPIVVEADREGLYVPGYQGRDRAGAGPFLITREEIERRHPLRVTDVLASVPGARVLRRANLNSVVLLRGDCVPTLVLDGIRVPNVEGIDRLVSPGDVESLRVYHGAELPIQYGLNHCGGVVIETRRGRASEEGEDEGPGGLWRRLVVVGLVVFGVFVIR